MTPPVIFSCVLFKKQPTSKLPAYSGGYSPIWVDKLYRGIKRHYTGPFEFAVFSDNSQYEFEEAQNRNFTHYLLDNPSLEWGCLMEPLRMSVEKKQRIIILGLDTVFTGNIDDIVETPLLGKVGLISDPYEKKEINNAIGIFDYPQARDLWIQWITRLSHWERVARYNNMLSEMAYLRIQCGKDAVRLDREHPGQILSYKAHVRHDKSSRINARMVHFHGLPKMGDPKITEKWIRENWV